MATSVQPCTDAHLGCTCGGDATTHEAGGARGELSAVECPECGGPTTARMVATWGNCRPCRTAQDRLTHPLRW